uniref:Nuclear protein 1b n=1 Tax=Oncorhynchus kisutch TaxID=8019 RepID=A0A8C7J1F6_ONCKI
LLLAGRFGTHSLTGGIRFIWPGRPDRCVIQRLNVDCICFLTKLPEPCAPFKAHGEVGSQHYDEYEYYNLSEKYTCGASRKGRSKKEASDNTNRPNPGGHERKLVEKLQNTEKKAKA